jgi:hypothetical protein
VRDEDHGRKSLPPRDNAVKEKPPPDVDREIPALLTASDKRI